MPVLEGHQEARREDRHALSEELAMRHLVQLVPVSEGVARGTGQHYHIRPSRPTALCELKLLQEVLVRAPTLGPPRQLPVGEDAEDHQGVAVAEEAVVHRRPLVPHRPRRPASKKLTVRLGNSAEATMPQIITSFRAGGGPSPTPRPRMSNPEELPLAQNFARGLDVYTRLQSTSVDDVSAPRSPPNPAQSARGAVSSSP